MCAPAVVRDVTALRQNTPLSVALRHVFATLQQTWLPWVSVETGSFSAATRSCWRSTADRAGELSGPGSASQGEPADQLLTSC